MKGFNPAADMRAVMKQMGEMYSRRDAFGGYRTFVG